MTQLAPSFYFNLPTHYLMWTSLLRAGERCTRTQLRARVQRYRLPRAWPKALQGAVTLGLLRADGGELSLTATGQAIQDALPYQESDWALTHAELRQGQLLLRTDPAAARALRAALLADPATHLLLDALASLGGAATLSALALRCARLDPARSAQVLLTPAGAAHAAQAPGTPLPAGALRPSTAYQRKRLMTHAGLLGHAPLRPERLDPDADHWTLHPDLDLLD